MPVAVRRAGQPVYSWQPAPVAAGTMIPKLATRPW
jgi:hypothetical protein